MVPEDCVDADPGCPGWAASGECDRNPGFMRGAATTLGTCRASCGDCVVGGRLPSWALCATLPVRVHARQSGGGGTARRSAGMNAHRLLVI